MPTFIEYRLAMRTAVGKDPGAEEAYDAGLAQGFIEGRMAAKAEATQDKYNEIKKRIKPVNEYIRMNFSGKTRVTIDGENVEIVQY